MSTSKFTQCDPAVSTFENGDIRLIAADMDGTLLDENGDIPDDFWPLLEELHRRGIVFAPASGRQYATLRSMFDGHTKGMTFIAENGGAVMRNDKEVFSLTVNPDVVDDVIHKTRCYADEGANVGIVASCVNGAYIERGDDDFLREVHQYSRVTTVVPDLAEYLAQPDADRPVKLALYDFNDVSQTMSLIFGQYRDSYEVALSGRHWADLLTRGVNKGEALLALQRTLGIDAAQTVVFGDYLNDLPMVDAAHYSFAMANAHPSLLEAFRFVAPSHTDHGVLTVVRELLDGQRDFDAGLRGRGDEDSRGRGDA